MEIKKDEKGKLKRVWVEQKVKDPTELLKLQGQISQVNPNFKPDAFEGLHMTMVHFGIPEELYADFESVLPALSFDQFMDQFYKLLQSSGGVVKEDVQVQADKLDVLGKMPYLVAVIRMIRTPEIMERRMIVNQALQKFIKDLGISDGHGFMLRSHNLQFEADEVYKPHITLGFVGENTTLPELNVSNLQITLKPSDIGGVKPT